MLRLNGNSSDEVDAALEALIRKGFLPLQVSKASPLLQDPTHPDALTALDVTGSSIDDVRAKLNQLGITGITVESVDSKEKLVA